MAPDFVRAVTLTLALGACAGSDRFALRPPLLHEGDDVPFAPRPAVRRGHRIANALDLTLLHPVSSALAIEVVGPAQNVNALDEVPDSSWFTNRDATPARAAEGACAGIELPRLPFDVVARKGDGTTPGLVARDATGRTFIVKIDHHPNDRPQTSTAADAIVSRLYWAIGYNTPCNVVIDAPRDAFRPAPSASQADALGQREPFTSRDLDSVLDQGLRDETGRIRVSASLVVSGEPLGPWPGTGTRHDDPNDAVAHEDRRELRGERLLAAWVNHWDAREANSIDAFEHEANGRAGFVRHYFVDWSDALGGHTSQFERAASLGWDTVVSLPVGPRRWRALRVDPRAPNLGYFAAAPFEPMRWQPLFPLPRFQRAAPDDLAWMARRMARITPEHLRAMIASGRFSQHGVDDRLLEVLLGRRNAAIREAFAMRSPLADPRVDGQRLCLDDLAVRAGVSDASGVSYASDWHDGPRLTPGVVVPHVEVEPAATVCLDLDASQRASSASSRYDVLDVLRTERNVTTRLRVHLYDLGPARGYVIAGLERPPPG